MNRGVVIRIVFLVVLVGVIAYANYPSLYKFFLLDQKTVVRTSEEKLEEAKKIIEPLQKVELLLPEIEKDRIRVLLKANGSFPIDNPEIQKILKDKFRYEETAEGKYLVWVKKSDQEFLSDFSKKLTELTENASKIKSIGLSEDKEKVVFTMVPEKRLSADSPPISSIAPKSKFDWVLDASKNIYLLSLSDPPNLLNLGLDIKGGVYLDVGIDPEKVFKALVDLKKESIRIHAGEAFAPTNFSQEGNKLIYSFNSLPSVNWSDPKFAQTLEGLDRSTEGNKLIFTLQNNYIQANEQNAVSQAMGIVRNRIDQLGVKEPIIQRRGADSIVVQIPGQNDVVRIKELITKAANLEFRLVTIGDASSATSDILDFETLDPITKEVVSVTPTPVEKTVAMRGDKLTDAKVVFDQFSGAPQVSMSLNAEGAKIFGDLTAANSGRSLAIILDNKVKSMPKINEAIYGGQASITGRFTVEEARDLSIVLRSGSLPVSLVVNEERVIGASLGEDAIKSALYSLVIGFAFLSAFIIFYYRLSGIFAVISLVINFFSILSILAFFGATLTLPGIAGIILTIAMAVDANVLVFERIREELHLGSHPRKAIQQGFSRVAITVLDANISTLLIAVVLFQFGTGPIKGFAVTLSIGIFTTLFSSLIFARVLFDLKYLSKAHLEKISI